MARKKAGKKTVVTPTITDPRQSYFLAYYLDPKSKTYANALQSALKAGYAQEYAENILSLMPEWLSEAIGKYRASTMLEKAERNLDEMMDLPSKTQAMGMWGPIVDKKTKKPVMVHNANLLKIKNDASQFVAERIGRKRYGKTGEAQTVNFNFYGREQIKRVAARVLDDESKSTGSSN